MDIEKIIDEVIQAEGGYVCDPSDSGGATCFGITETVARANGFYGNMRDLPLSTAKTIYRNRYYYEPKFDQVAVLTPKVAAELTDMGVNMGVNFAKTTLQESLNLLNRQGEDYKDISEDGSIGKETLAALALLLAKRGEDLILKTLILLRGAKYLAICKSNPTQEKFLVGWISNRVHLYCKD